MPAKASMSIRKIVMPLHPILIHKVFKLWVITSVLFTTILSFAQQKTDSIPRKHLDWIIPSSFIAYGAIGTFIPKLHIKHKALQAKVFALSNNGPHYEDYVQYLPLAAVYALDLTKMEAQSKPLDQTLKLGMAYANLGIVVNTIKYTSKIERPDGSSNNSFPSGHTATAFIAAEFLRQEFGKGRPAITLAGYAAACYVGTMRMMHNRHYLTDVFAGAGIGILSVQMAYWIYPKIVARLQQRNSEKSAETMHLQSFVTPFGAGLRLVFN